MTLNIRSEKADALARQLAQLDGTTITEAVVAALRDAIDKRLKQETPQETARRILAKHQLSFKEPGLPVATRAYHDLDHDLTAE